MSHEYRTVLHRADVMGTVVSLRVVVDPGAVGDRAEAARACASDGLVDDVSAGDTSAADMSALEARINSSCEDFIQAMRRDEEVFTTYQESSVIRRLATGQMTWDQVPDCVREVEAACRWALEVTGGRFDAWWQGWFDPTGYVKGWSVERAFGRHLLPLYDRKGVVAVGVYAGGDIRFATSAKYPHWRWRTAVVNPLNPQQLVGRIELLDGAIATSGIAERGEHIVNPATSCSATRGPDQGIWSQAIASATVVAHSLDVADMWATTAVVAGFEDLGWIADADIVSGMVIAVDGRERRWVDGFEIVDSDDALPAVSPGP